MSSERSRAFIIFGVVAVVAAGAGYTFFKVYQPRKAKQAAQAEVDAWEVKWKAARDCLLGPDPLSAKTSEALALREMNPDPWNRGACTPLISRLTRGDAPDSGFDEVEAAWSVLDKAAGKAAQSFATHISNSTTLKEDPLPAALDGLDEARAALRRAAGMPELAQSGKALAAATIVPLDLGTWKLEQLSVDTKPSAHGMVVFGRAQQANKDVQLQLRTGEAPIVKEIAGTLRAVPDMTWGATATADGIDSGPLDEHGLMPDKASVKLPGATIFAIIGAAATGRVIYGTDTRFAVAHADKADPPVTTIGSRSALDVDGRAVVVWTDKTGEHGRIFHPDPAADEPVADLGENDLGPVCLTADRAWTATGAGVISFGGGKPPVARANPFYKLIGCANDGALFRSIEDHKPFLVCTDDCKSVALPHGAPALSATTIVNGKLYAIASHGSVLGVWREDAPPVFYGLPVTAEPVMAQEYPAMALSNGKAIDVIARGAAGFVLIRIPA